MSDELKPCPFCGTTYASPTAIEEDDRVDKWLQVTEAPGPLFYVECFGCGVEARWFPTREEAIAAWNRRHTEES